MVVNRTKKKRKERKISVWLKAWIGGTAQPVWHDGSGATLTASFAPLAHTGAAEKRGSAARQNFCPNVLLSWLLRQKSRIIPLRAHRKRSEKVNSGRGTKREAWKMQKSGENKQRWRLQQVVQEFVRRLPLLTPPTSNTNFRPRPPRRRRGEKKKLTGGSSDRSPRSFTVPSTRQHCG